MLVSSTIKEELIGKEDYMRGGHDEFMKYEKISNSKRNNCSLEIESILKILSLYANTCHLSYK